MLHRMDLSSPHRIYLQEMHRVGKDIPSFLDNTKQTENAKKDNRPQRPAPPAEAASSIRFVSSSILRSSSDSRSPIFPPPLIGDQCELNVPNTAQVSAFHDYIRELPPVGTARDKKQLLREIFIGNYPPHHESAASKSKNIRCKTVGIHRTEINDTFTDQHIAATEFVGHCTVRHTGNTFAVRGEHRRHAAAPQPCAVTYRTAPSCHADRQHGSDRDIVSPFHIARNRNISNTMPVHRSISRYQPVEIQSGALFENQIVIDGITAVPIGNGLRTHPEKRSEFGLVPKAVMRHYPIKNFRFKHCKQYVYSGISY